MVPERPRWQLDIPPLMPQALRQALLAMELRDAAAVREIRIPAVGPVGILGLTDGFLREEGTVTGTPERAVRLRAGECRQVFEAITGHAPYARADDIARGYLTLPGGYRVGLGGEVACTRGRITHMKAVTSLNIRIVRAVTGAADALMGHICPGSGQLRSTLILSVPGMGKTTMIRDIARQLSDGAPRRGGVRVAIIDERGEIGGCREGTAAMDVGVRTDILDGCPKAEGLLWAIRSLAPRVVITDEIGSEDDARALIEARNAGVAVVASAHAAGIRDAFRRPSLRLLAEEAIFDLYALLGPETPGAVAQIVRGERAVNAL
ncbi:MAG: stage III sporulation protein AA [Clostridiales bacterium]|nr:stage III sporulation protein AA [Clostridiales bacterium]